MLREYELFYIIRPDLDDEQVRTTMDEIAEVVAADGGEVAKSSLWGRRRLAYQIAGFTDGYYVLKEITLPGERLRELERQLRLDERVIRSLITLSQVYYLPEDEDRRGRPRVRSRRAEAGVPAEDQVADEGAEGVEAEDLDVPEETEDADLAVEQDEAAEPDEGEE
ncbi:MAG: 30S ribosomal protein S6 [Candidatus Dormibacteria bacterium]